MPSTHWPASPFEKEAKIQAFRDYLRDKPCRTFAASAPGRPWCPYGRDCNYSHRLPNGRVWQFHYGYADTLARARARREAEARREEDDFAHELYVRFVQDPGRYGTPDPAVVLGHLLRHNSLPARVSQLLQHAGLDMAMLQTDRADDWDDEGDVHEAAFQLFGLPPPSARHRRSETSASEQEDLPALVPIVASGSDESDASSMPDLIPIGDAPRGASVSSSASSSMPGLVPIEDFSTRRSFTSPRDTSDDDAMPGLIPLDSPSDRSTGLGRSDDLGSASDDMFHDPFDDFHDDLYHHDTSPDFMTAQPARFDGPAPSGTSRACRPSDRAASPPPSARVGLARIDDEAPLDDDSDEHSDDERSETSDAATRHVHPPLVRVTPRAARTRMYDTDAFSPTLQGASHDRDRCS